jgi:hypothetical protein
MSYRLDFIEMMEERYIADSLFSEMLDHSVRDNVYRLYLDLRSECSNHRPNLDKIFNFMSELQFYKLALTSKINTSVTESDEGTRYINARASVTLKSRGKEKSKRIWATHYLGPYFDFVTNNGKVDIRHVKYKGRGPVVLKLVEKLKMETLT